MQGPHGPSEFGPFQTFEECRVNAAWHYATDKLYHDRVSVCSYGNRKVKISEKNLPANLRKGKK